MGMFVCDKCHAFENTAVGWFHSRYNNQCMLGEQYPDGEAYCHVCTPRYFSSGEPIEVRGGKGVQKEREIADKVSVAHYIKNGSLKPPFTRAVLTIMGSEATIRKLLPK
jgi:hypothetical protein